MNNRRRLHLLAGEPSVGVEQYDSTLLGPHFERYIGINYSGAETPSSSLKGLRVYWASGEALASEVLPPPSPRQYWTRRNMAEWLAECLVEEVPTLVGIGHGFSFPLRYFEIHHLLPDWDGFLDDFQHHWPTDSPHAYVDFIRDGIRGNGAARTGNPRWRRICEEHCQGKSVFDFDALGSRAKLTHAGLPWLRLLRQQLGSRLHFWPFDGWEIPAGRSAVVEVYPALWKNTYASEDRTSHQHDAYTVVNELRRMDREGSLPRAGYPHLSLPERQIAQIEGWIWGVE